MPNTVTPKKVKKRDGTVVKFNKAKIGRAITRAAF